MAAKARKKSAIPGDDQNHGPVDPSSISGDLTQGHQDQEEGESLEARVRQRKPLYFSNLEIIQRKLNKTATGKVKESSGKKGKKGKKGKMTLPCDYLGETERNLAAQKSNKHSGQGPGLSCQFCGSQFGSSNNLKIHINSQHLGLREVCTECGKHFAAKAILQMHFKEKHEDGNDLKCNFCDKSFSRKDSKDRHVKKAHPEV